MYIPTTLVLLLLPIAAFAGKHRRHHARGHVPHPAAYSPQPNTYAQPNNTSGSKYTLHELYKGDKIIQEWVYFHDPDPTNGPVNYLTQQQAQEKGLAYVDKDGVAVLAVDSKSPVAEGGKRDSIRISSPQTYNTGLFIADFVKMPTGCGVWPAYWSTGAGWPSCGEVDIIEGVNKNLYNQYTLHTGEKCTLPTDGSKIGVKANLMYNVCQSQATDNRGCGFLDTDSSSFGEGFNSARGGVYAHNWNDDGVSIWFFSRDQIPLDITTEQPNPSSWGPPSAAWSSQYCDISSALYNHTLIINTSLCGDWARDAYPSSGCPGTCAQIMADPTNFQNATWNINYIAVYQS